MKLNAMNSIAEDYLEAVELKLDQITRILNNNANFDMSKKPSNEEQRKAMANPVEFQNLLGTAVIQLHNGQKIYYRFPYPLPNGAFLLKGELRTPGFCIPIAPPKEPLDLENEKSHVWAGEIYRLNGTIKWLEGYAKQNRIKVAEELQKNLMKWEPKPNVSFKKTLQRPNFPLVDRTNPLSEVASIREIRFPTSPPKTDEYSPKDIPERAKVHKSHLGRVCILETSDDKPGEVLYLAQGACVKIKNGQSRIVSQDSDCLFSYSCSLVPFIQHNKPIRAFIGGRELKQALPLLDPEIPLVCTGVEKEVAEESGRVIRARRPGKVIKSNWTPQGGEIQVQRDSDGKEDHYPLAGYCHVRSGEFQGACYYEKTCVDNQQRVTEGKILAEGCGVKDGKLALGVNLLVAYMPWFGYNFEDAIVISKRAAKLLTSVHVYEEKDERDPEEIRVKVEEEELFSIDAKFEGGLNQNIISEDLQEVFKTKGFPLPENVAVTKEKENEWAITNEEDFIVKKESGKLKIYRKIKYGTELTDKVRFSRYTQHGEVVRILKSQDGLKIWILEERPAEIGDKITNRHGNKGVISLILPESEMPYFYVNREKRVIDVILNPTSVISRVNLGQVLETHFGWIIHEITCRDDLKEFRNDMDELKNVGAPFKEIKVEQLKQLKDLLVETGLSKYGKAEVCRTVNGKKEKFGTYVVGYQYFVKLRHLARDKLIAAGKTGKRERDPWSCQPEKGNSISDFGIWALIAHKADSLAQELLTIRSDDINGSDLRPGESLKVFYPESLRLIVQFLRGLGLEVEVKVPESLNEFNFSVEKIQVVKLRAATCAEMKKWGETMKTKKKKSKYAGFISFDKPWLGLYEIPEAFRPYNIGDKEYELARHYRKMKGKATLHERLKGLLKSLKEGKDSECLIQELIELSKNEKSFNKRLTRLEKLNKENLQQFLMQIIELNKEDLQESLRELIEGVKVKKFSWDDVPGKENFYPRAERGILDFLKGKTGLFRDGSLGKQSDYSAMAVIVPDPNLKINQISLPKVVLKELELEKDEPILAVRHPVLHRYGTLAFYPQERDDFAIGIPPLLCKGFGADFDGDPMMVFRAISQEAQKELANLFPTSHLYSSATGELNLHLTQDFILGKLGEQIAPDVVRECLREQFENAMSTIKENPHHNEQKIYNASENKILKLQTEILGNRCQAGRNKQKDAAHSEISVGIFDIQELLNYFTNRDVTEQELKNFLQEHPQNPLCLMALSKARGKKLAQLREMVGQIGMVKMSDTEIPSISTNFLKGLSGKDYKVYAQFARDTLFQNSRAPQDPGVAVREYYNKAGNLLITERDCGANEGINLGKKYLLGRVPVDNNSESKTLKEKDLAWKKDGYELKVRSPLYCKSKSGICSICYGWDLSSQKLPEEGWRVGAISVQSILENLYQAELKVIHKDPQADWGNKVKEFKDALTGKDKKALKDRLIALQKLGLNVDSRHFEVILRAEIKEKEEEQGWLARASYRDARREVSKAFKNPSEDKLKVFTSRLLLGQNPRQTPPESSEGKWAPLAYLLPRQKDTSESPPYHKQIWSVFYLDERSKVFVKRDKRKKNIEKLKKAIADETWSYLVNIANKKNKWIGDKYLFNIDDGELLGKELNKRIIPERLKKMFESKGIPLSENITITKKTNVEWMITDEEKNIIYFIRKEEEKLNIYEHNNIETRYCKDHAIVGPDGKEIPLQQLFKLKEQGRPEEQLHKDIREWLSTISKEDWPLSFRELAKRFKKKCPKYNSESKDTIKNKLRDIFKEQVKKDFPTWLDTIPEENLSISTEKLVEQFKKDYPKYSRMETIMDIDTVKEHIELIRKKHE